jgi:glycosyltransferase involved in cell wall biosynthesis
MTVHHGTESALSEVARSDGKASPTSLLFISSLRWWGGGETWMVSAAGAMRARGHRVLLVAQPDSELAAHGRAAGLDVAAVRLGGLFDPFSLAALAGQLRRARVDVVCANLDKEIRQSRLAALLAGRRVRLVARRGSPVAIKNRWHYRLVFKHGVDRLICNAQALVDPVLVAAPWFPRRRIRVIPNGVDLADLRRRAQVSDVRTELGLSPETLVIACIGEVGWRKGQEHVLAAAATLRARFPASVWLIAGEGSGREELTAQARDAGLLTDGYVRFLGFRSDAPSIMAAADLLVLPSRSEGFPNALLEGMALGLPIAASCADGIPELVVDGQNGLLHPIDDTERFTADVARLLSDAGLRRRLGEAGARRAAENFAFAHVMDQVEDCLCRW